MDNSVIGTPIPVLLVSVFNKGLHSALKVKIIFLPASDKAILAPAKLPFAKRFTDI